MGKINHTEFEMARERVGDWLVDTLIAQGGGEKIEPHVKTKGSFSIPKSTQVLIQVFSKEAGIAQGDMVKLVPSFFKFLISTSIKRRNESIKELEFLSGEIEQSFEKMKKAAPHLSSYFSFFSNLIDDLIADEKISIEEKNYIGIKPSNSVYEFVEEEKENPAFYYELFNVLKNDLESLALADVAFDIAKEEGYDY